MGQVPIGHLRPDRVIGPLVIHDRTRRGALVNTFHTRQHKGVVAAFVDLRAAAIKPDLKIRERRDIVRPGLCVGAIELVAPGP